VFWALDAPHRLRERVERRAAAARRWLEADALAAAQLEGRCMADEDAEAQRLSQGPTAAAQLLVLAGGGKSGGKHHRRSSPGSHGNDGSSRPGSPGKTSSRPGSPAVGAGDRFMFSGSPERRIVAPRNSDDDDDDDNDDGASYGFHSESDSDYTSETASLPEGWHEAFDHSTGAPFRVCASSGATSWEPPPRGPRRRVLRPPPPDPRRTVSYVLPPVCFQPWPPGHGEPC
jgi:hypothetical protein